MARRARTSFRKWSKETREAMRETKDMSSDKALSYLKKKKIKPQLTVSETRRIINKVSREKKVPITITSRIPKGYENADGVAINQDGKLLVRIHPIARYYDKRYVEDLARHETDHIDVYRKRKK